jgi:hypothetical protein
MLVEMLSHVRRDLGGVDKVEVGEGVGVYEALQSQEKKTSE